MINIINKQQYRHLKPSNGGQTIQFASSLIVIMPISTGMFTLNNKGVEKMAETMCLHRCLTQPICRSLHPARSNDFVRFSHRAVFEQIFENNLQHAVI